MVSTVEVFLLWSTPKPEEYIACEVLKTENVSPSDREAVLREIIKSENPVALEAASATFLLKDTSVASLLQLTLHCSLTVTTLPNPSYKRQGFYISHALNKYGDLGMEFFSLMLKSCELYEKMINLGLTEYEAGLVLPCAVNVTAIVSANFKEWLDVLRMHFRPEVLLEIHDICAKIGKRLFSIAPIIFEAYGSIATST